MQKNVKKVKPSVSKQRCHNVTMSEEAASSFFFLECPALIRLLYMFNYSTSCFLPMLPREITFDKSRLQLQQRWKNGTIGKWLQVLLDRFRVPSVSDFTSSLTTNVVFTSVPVFFLSFILPNYFTDNVAIFQITKCREKRNGSNNGKLKWSGLN